MSDVTVRSYPEVSIVNDDPTLMVRLAADDARTIRAERVDDEAAVLATFRLVKAMTVKPSAARAQLIRETIGALIDAGLWTKFGLLYVLAAHHEQAGRLNWVNPGTATLTAVSAPTFTTDRGYQGNGTSSYLETGIQTGSLPVITQNSGHLGGWILAGTDAADTNKMLWGHSLIGASRLTMCPRTSIDRLQARVANGTAVNFGTSAIGTAFGYSLASRRAAADLEGYRNGASVGTSTQASDPLGDNTGTMRLLSQGTNFADFQVAVAHIGSGLTDADAATLHAIFSTYLAAVGAI